MSRSIEPKTAIILDELEEQLTKDTQEALAELHEEGIHFVNEEKLVEQVVNGYVGSFVLNSSKQSLMSGLKQLGKQKASTTTDDLSAEDLEKFAEFLKLLGIK